MMCNRAGYGTILISYKRSFFLLGLVRFRSSHSTFQRSLGQKLFSGRDVHPLGSMAGQCLWLAPLCQRAG